MKNLRIYSLLVPVAFASIGAGLFSIFTFAFDSVTILPPQVQHTIILIAGICMAAGAELGTPGTVIEVYRKQHLGKARGWDWIALTFSLCATLVAVAVAFARRMDVANTWAEPVSSWGPLAVVAFVALDTYGAYIELGSLFAEEQKTKGVEVEVTTPSPMRWTEFKPILSGMNGERKGLTVDSIRSIVTKDGRPSPSDKTLARWIERI